MIDKTLSTEFQRNIVRANDFHLSLISFHSTSSKSNSSIEKLSSTCSGGEGDGHDSNDG